MLLPVYKGKEVVASALVDDDLFDILNQKIWRLTPKGYVTRSQSFDGKEFRLLLHRVVMSAPAEMQVDHIDRNPLNNQRSNLRLVDNSLNQHNRGISKKNTSGATNVYWDKERSRWRVRSWLNDKSVDLGRYKEYDEAVEVAQRFKEQLLKG